MRRRGLKKEAGIRGVIGRQGKWGCHSDAFCSLSPTQHQGIWPGHSAASGGLECWPKTSGHHGHFSCEEFRWERFHWLHLAAREPLASLLFTSGESPMSDPSGQPNFFFFQMSLPGTIFTTLQWKKLGHWREKLSISFEPSVLMILLYPLNNLLPIHSQVCPRAWYISGIIGVLLDLSRHEDEVTHGRRAERWGTVYPVMCLLCEPKSLSCHPSFYMKSTLDGSLKLGHPA